MLNLIFALGMAQASELSTGLPNILGCPAFWVLKDKEGESGEVRVLVRVTKDGCVYADPSGKTGLMMNSKPKK